MLMDEHRVIEQVLSCLEKLADRCAAGKKLDSTSVLQALEFLGSFADRCHHGKEEGHLFPLLEARGLHQDGPTGVMRHEHEEGRRLIAAMTRAAKRQEPGAFGWHARAYIELLRAHIRKEDHCLFPMAAGILSDSDAEWLAQRFEHVEHADMGEDTHEHYLELANDLADRLDVSRAQVTPHCSHARCQQHQP
jgi:hemerythrin-like domain-containing protein